MLCSVVIELRFIRNLRTGCSCKEVDNQVFLFDVKQFHQGGSPSWSTSLLYHGFGIKGYQYVNTKYEGGAVMIYDPAGAE